ncbi:MAG: hypothetical protein CMG49_05185 [Candidatus Marinimicrobia bacterium]|nr:hypothetical protein [Candidatus Neomarinimicrobiota bacterium]|tara:strand:+ start:1837 stop:2049 length:213 start_codon:yes stop_codon:yes gene_type:complete
MKIKDNFKFQIFICIIIGSIMIYYQFFLSKSLDNFKFEINNFKFKWEFLLDDDEYKINTKSKKKIKPKII